MSPDDIDEIDDEEDDEGEEYVPKPVTPELRTEMDAWEWRNICRTLEGCTTKEQVADRIGATGGNMRLVNRWLEERGIK